MAIKTPITVAYGDGIGPEIMAATLKILEAAGAQIEPEVVEVGEKLYKQGITTGIADETWDSLKRTKVLLKGPITTPQGGGYKSLNVTIRKTLGLYANVRPTVALAPYVPTKFPKVDMVIVRENEEGLYSGIEHRQCEGVYQCLKLISREGCERIVHYAFEYAQKFNRKRVTCMSKDNIMKMTDGIFHQVFNEVAAQYPDIESDHYIIDIGTAIVAADPERFDVIVTSNLYGDIISDVAAQVVGSVGLAGSANIGDHMAMFEAIHGSAPDIAGKKMANPSGLINGAIQMLNHIGQSDVASNIQNAWLRTLEDGMHTGDIYSETHSEKQVNTDEFADAVIERLGQKPDYFNTAVYSGAKDKNIVCYGETKKSEVEKKLVGVDIFIDNHHQTPESLGEKLEKFEGNLKILQISNRGLKVWPDSKINFPSVTHACCRFQMSDDYAESKQTDILEILQQCNEANLDVIKTENLYTYDGELGFSLSQGQ